MDLLKCLGYGTLCFVLFVYEVDADANMTHKFLPCFEDSEIEITCTDDDSLGTEFTILNDTNIVRNCNSTHERMSVSSCINTTIIVRIKHVKEYDYGQWICEGTASGDNKYIDYGVFPQYASINRTNDEVICEACGSNDTLIKGYKDGKEVTNDNGTERVSGEACEIDGWTGTFLQRLHIHINDTRPNDTLYMCKFGFDESFSNCSTLELKIEPSPDSPPEPIDNPKKLSPGEIAAITVSVLIVVVAGICVVVFIVSPRLKKKKDFGVEMTEN